MLLRVLLGFISCHFLLKAVCGKQEQCLNFQGDLDEQNLTTVTVTVTLRLLNNCGENTKGLSGVTMIKVKRKGINMTDCFILHKDVATRKDIECEAVSPCSCSPETYKYFITYPVGTTLNLLLTAELDNNQIVEQDVIFNDQENITPSTSTTTAVALSSDTTSEHQATAETTNEANDTDAGVPIVGVLGGFAALSLFIGIAAAVSCLRLRINFSDVKRRLSIANIRLNNSGALYRGSNVDLMVENIIYSGSGPCEVLEASPECQGDGNSLSNDDIMHPPRCGPASDFIFAGGVPIPDEKTKRDYMDTGEPQRPINHVTEKPLLPEPNPPCPQTDVYPTEHTNVGSDIYVDIDEIKKRKSEQKSRMTDWL